MFSQDEGPVRSRLRRGNMDELIGQLAAKASIDRSVAEKTIGIILGFLRSEGPSDRAGALIDRIPSRDAAIAATNIGTSARLMGNGVRAVAAKLMSLGLFASAPVGPSSSGSSLAGPSLAGPSLAGSSLAGSDAGIVEIQTVARELLRLRRDKIGADHMGEIIAGTPGLSQFA